jgi:hypothetical protein
MFGGLVVSECATVRVSRTIEVAAGVFAPGHLGRLTPLLPWELVDAVLAECLATQRRLRMLPSRVGVYLVLAAALFPRAGLLGVWSRLTAGLSGLSVPAPSEKALRDLRCRVGPEPLRMLFDTVSGSLAWPGMAGVRYRRWRTVAFDGCSSFRVPDSPRNRGRFGITRGGAGYPMLMLMALVETGTRGLVGAVFGPTSIGELAWAGRLLQLLGPEDLVLCDRAFDAQEFLFALHRTKAAFLVRAQASRTLPVLAVLPDGSFLTRLEDLKLRVICAQVSVTGADGTRLAMPYRLLTTLTDHRSDPAAALVDLYHQRWEIESAFQSLRHTLTGRPVLRSCDPAGIDQEMWALLTVYQVLRTVMADAAAGRPGTDPDRCSFTTALAAACDSITVADTGINDGSSDLPGPIGAAVLARLLPQRRLRFSARTVKTPTSRYQHRRDDPRPARSTAITAINIAIDAPDQPQPPPAVDAATVFAALPGLSRHTGPDLLHAIGVMLAEPGRPHKARDLARRLGQYSPAELNRFCVALSKRSLQGLIVKTAPATYMIKPGAAHPLTTTTEP